MTWVDIRNKKQLSYAYHLLFTHTRTQYFFELLANSHKNSKNHFIYDLMMLLTLTEYFYWSHCINRKVYRLSLLLCIPIWFVDFTYSTHLIFIRAISMHWELMWIIIYPAPLAVWQNSVQKTVSPPRLHVKLHIHIVNFFNAVKLRWMDWYIEISIRWMFVSEFKVLWKIGFSFSSNSIHDLFISIALCNQSHWLHICELISDLLTWQVVRLYESKYDEQNNPDRY